MTPIEKAKHLTNSMYIAITEKNYPNIGQQQTAKQCALIAVEEILKGDHLIRTPISFWEQVKSEIKKL